MKVLFLTNLPSPYRAMFFCELGKLCDLTVLYERSSASGRDEKWVAHTEKTYREIYLKGWQIGEDNSLSFEVAKRLKTEIYDLCVIGMYSTYTAMLAIAYLKSHRIPFVINTDGGFIKRENRFKKGIKTVLLGSANAWLSTGEPATEYLEYYGAKAEKIYVYPFTSVSEREILRRPLSHPEKMRLREKLGLTGEKIVISVGQFIERKGYDILLEAVPMLAGPAEIYIVGGKQAQLEEATGKSLPENVHVIEFLEREKLLDYYKASDLFVLPTREDVWGLVVNEAMACGLPVITTDRCVAGCELVREGKNGYIVPVEDAEQLARRIDQIFAEDHEGMGTESLAVIQGYTFEKMARRHLQIFESLTQREDRGSPAAMQERS